MIMLGVILILLVMRRLSHGARLQFNAPSDTICPAIVQIIPALTPESKSARAKMVPAAGAKLDDSKSYMPKRSADAAELLDEREAPATMRIALLTKSANVKRVIDSSATEYLRQNLIAGRDGWYFCSSELLKVEAGTRPALTSYSWRRAWTIPLPRYRLWGITVAPRMPHA